MNTIELITIGVIDQIKSFPQEAKQYDSEGSPKTVWDEYKEQVQFEEWDSFEIMQETIDSMAEDAVLEFTLEYLEELYHSIYDTHDTPDEEDMVNYLKNEILALIHEAAESEEIEYNTPSIKYVQYFDDNIGDEDLTFVAEVIKRVNPSDYLLHTYSHETAPQGIQEVLDLNYLDEFCGLDRITFEKFEEIKKSFYHTPLS